MTILLRLDDQMNRQLTCQINEEESSEVLAQELVDLGFINEVRSQLKICENFIYL